MRTRIIILSLVLLYIILNISCKNNREFYFDQTQKKSLYQIVSNYKKLKKNEEYLSLISYKDSVKSSSVSDVEKNLILILDISFDTELSSSEKILLLGNKKKDEKNPFLYNQICFQLYHNYINLSNYNEGIRVLGDNITLLNNFKNDFLPEIAKSYHQIGYTAHIYSENGLQSIDAYVAAAEHSILNGDYNRAGSAMYNASLIPDSLSNNSRLYFCQKTIEYFTKGKDYNGLISSGYVGLIYATTNIDTIRKYTEKSKLLFDQGKVSDEKYYGFLIHVLNTSLDEDNRLYEEYYKHVEKHLSTLKESHYQKSYFYFSVFRYAQKTNKPLNEQKKYLLKSLEEANKLDENHFKISHSILILDSCIQLDLLLKNHLEVIKWYEIKDKFADQLKETRSNEKELDKIQMNLWHNQEIDLLEKLNAKEKIIAARNRSLFIASLILILIIAYILIRLKQSNVKIKDSQKEIKKANEVIKSNNQKLHKTLELVKLQNVQLEEKKNEIASELKSKLALLSNNLKNSHAISETIKDSDEISSSLKKEILKKIDSTGNKRIIEEMDVQFLKLNKEIYTKLSKLHPNLTNNNLKLCVYINSNLTSKEIASLNFTSVEAIKVARSRLRKKLGINSQEYTLTAYLNSVLNN